MIWGEFSAIHIHIQPSEHPPHVPINLEELCIEIGIQVSRADKWSRPYRVSWENPGYLGGGPLTLFQLLHLLHMDEHRGTIYSHFPCEFLRCNQSPR